MAHERLLRLLVAERDCGEAGFGGIASVVIADLAREEEVSARGQRVLPQAPSASPAQGDPPYLPLQVPVHGVRLDPPQRAAEPGDDVGTRGRLR